MDLEISALTDDAAARKIAAWQYAEWGSGYSGAQLADFEADVRRAIGSRTIPMVLVAAVGGDLIGTASLVENDLPSRSDLNPWLASVFVRRDMRGRGVATELIKAAIARADALAVRRLFLFTHDLAQFYASFGWIRLDRGEFMNQKVDILVREPPILRRE